MGIFSQPVAKPDVATLPFEQAYVAVEAINAAIHVDRVISIKAGIVSKERALENARERLQSLRAAIANAREPDGDAVAQAILSGDELPAVSSDLERERDQLAAGIAALSRQINEDHRPLREPWNELKDEVADALEPLIEELYRRAQAAIEQIENLYAASVALSRVARSGRIEKLRQFSGTVLAHGREFRLSFEFQTELPVDPSLLAFNDLPAIKAMRYGMPETVAPPSQLQMEHDGVR